jgi:hypothetical protein
MGFHNPSVPWSEIPRPLSDKRRPGHVPANADGGDSPACSRKRGPYVSQTGARRALTAWAGPWPLDERWWDSAAARTASRFQVVDGEGMAWLLVCDGDAWTAEATYD